MDSRGADSIDDVTQIPRYEAQGSNWGTNISVVWFVKIFLVLLKSTLTLPLTVPDLEAVYDIVDKERDAVSTPEYTKNGDLDIIPFNLPDHD